MHTPIWWLLSVFLILSPGPGPKEGEKEKNWENKVNGRRYDYSVEVSERIDRLGELSKLFLSRRELVWERALGKLARVVSVQTEGREALEKIRRITAAEARLKVLHPVCTYLVDGSQGALLKAGGRLVLDSLRNEQGESRATRLERCRTIANGLHRAMCEYAILHSDHPLCKLDSESVALCTKMEQADLRHTLPDVSTDIDMYTDAVRLERFGEAIDCDTAAAGTRRQACTALRSGDATRCPPWQALERREAPNLHQDLSNTYVDIDYTLVQSYEPEEARMYVAWLPRPGVRCEVSYLEDGVERIIARTSLGPWTTRVAVEILAVNQAPVGAALAVSCRGQRDHEMDSEK